MPGMAVKRTLRRVAPIAFVVLALTGAAYAISRDSEELRRGLGRIDAASLALALGCCLLGTAAMFKSWACLLDGLGAQVSTRSAGVLFFTSQLGKYLPGAVWPIVAQMEYGRRTGTPRKVMLAANLLALAVSLGSGLALAAILLPVSMQGSATRFWWVLIALPVLMLAIHPRTIPALLDVVLRRLGREPIDSGLDWSHVVPAWSWAIASWVVYGLHAFVLVAAIGPVEARDLLLCIGGFALAVTAGVMFLPAPAGAGVRDAILVGTLGITFGLGTALAVGLVSRVVMIVADLTLAAGAWLVGRARTSQP